jgi:hypothetical protein
MRWDITSASNSHETGVQAARPLDPRPSAYSAGLELMRSMAGLEPTTAHTSTRRTSGINRQRHVISETEYIDSETQFTIEESYTEAEWRY